MSKTSARKLPWWNTIIFSLTPALLLFVIVEGAARIEWAHLEAEAFTKHPYQIVNFVEVTDAVVGYRLAPNYDSKESMFTTSIGRFRFKFPMHY